jgi:hypothetical protein
MAKKFYKMRCVHCLKQFEELTSDHVLPESWYPDNTPDNLEKWQVPSCHKCNWEHGRNEEELFLKLALHFNPVEGHFTKIAQKVYRSMSPEHGKSKKDRENRRKRRIRIIKEISQASKLNYNIENILPGFGYNPNFSPNMQPPILISKDKLERFAEKVTRGVLYLINNAYVESDHEITIFVPAENVPQQCRQILRQYGKEYSCGPGIHVIMAVCFDDNYSALLEISIWDHFSFCSIISPQHNGDNLKNVATSEQ